MTDTQKYSLTKQEQTDENDYIDQDGTSWNSPEDWLWIGILGGCGCGNSYELSELVLKVLELFATEHEKREFSVYDDLKYEIIAHWLDSKDLIEHGTSINGSWLTEKGESIYNVIKTLL